MVLAFEDNCMISHSLTKCLQERMVSIIRCVFAVIVTESKVFRVKLLAVRSVFKMLVLDIFQ